MGEAWEQDCKACKMILSQLCFECGGATELNCTITHAYTDV